jgi:hypothetical protein
MIEKMKEKGLPTVFLCFKSRNEDIDNDIVDYLEKIGFEGNQVKFLFVIKKIGCNGVY